MPTSVSECVQMRANFHKRRLIIRAGTEQGPAVAEGSEAAAAGNATGAMAAPPRERAKSCKPETSECSDRDEPLLEHGKLLEPCLRLGYAREFPIGDRRNE